MMKPVLSKTYWVSRLGTLLFLVVCPLSWSQPAKVRVDGVEVSVIEHRVRGRLNCANAHFTITREAELEVTLPNPVGHVVLSPASRNIPLTHNGGTLRFAMKAPQYLVLRLDDTRLLLLADPPDTVPSAAKVLNVTQEPYSADPTGQNDSTKGLQRALDAAGKMANGTVVNLPPGTYVTTGIRIPSHTDLHLDKGAILRGSDRAEDYAEYPKEQGKTGISSLIRIADAERVRVYGCGTMDARGFALAGDAATIDEVRLKARCFTIERSRHITIEDVICREATSWTLPFFHCSDVAARRIKVMNDIGPLEHSDGINLCATQRGLVEDCFVHTTDDAFCAKGHEGGPSEDLVFRRLVALSATRGLKCGQQAYAPMRRIRFEDVDIVQTRDGIDLMHWDGAGDWEDILFKNIRVEKYERRSISATIREGGSIRGVRFENVSFTEARPGFLRGKDAQQRIEGVVFSGLRIASEEVKTLDAAGIEANKFVAPVTFEK